MPGPVRLSKWQWAAAGLLLTWHRVGREEWMIQTKAVFPTILQGSTEQSEAPLNQMPHQALQSGAAHGRLPWAALDQRGAYEDYSPSQPAPPACCCPSALLAWPLLPPADTLPGTEQHRPL